MKAILTVIGKDRVGIVYEIAKKCSEYNINIVDINQTLMDDFFTMVVLVDYKHSIEDFVSVASAFEALGTQLNLQVKLQNEEIFNSIYTV